MSIGLPAHQHVLQLQVDEIWKWGRDERREQDGALKLGNTRSV